MSKPPELSIPIDQKRTLLLCSTSSETSFQYPIYAINWFNTKRPWLYDLYNLLAWRSVKKVDGKLLIKARTVEQLWGDQQEHRDLFVLVRYPSVFSFQSLLKSTYFKMISVVRIKAVRKFNFGFATIGKIASHKTKDLSKAYAVFHVQGPLNDEWMQKLVDVAKTFDLDLFYGGKTAVTLHLKSGNQEPVALPFGYDGIMVWMATEPESIRAFVRSTSCQTLLEEINGGYIGLLDRIR